MAVPKIRFPEFSDEWRLCSLEEILTERNVKQTISEDAPLLSFTIEQGVINPEDKKTNKRDFLMKDKSTKTFALTEVDDIIYNPANLKFGAIHRNKLRRGVVSPIYAIFYTDQNPAFVEALVRNPRFIKKSLTYLEGSVIKLMTLKPRDFVKMQVYLPSIEEQRKIAELLSKIDNVIALCQAEIKKTQEFKRGLLQKMFPKAGQNMPELRFPGFTDAWEQYKLGQMCSEFQSGDFISADRITQDDVYPVFGGNGLRGYTSRYNHDGVYALIGRQGALCGNMNISYGKAYFTEHAVAVAANSSHDTEFLYYLFGILNLGQYSGQSAQPGLAVSKLITVSASTPKLNEQRQISGLLLKLDHLITLHQRECEKWQMLKQCLLQKMFV